MPPRNHRKWSTHGQNDAIQFVCGCNAAIMILVMRQ
jgi:hypothetical protein